MKPASAFWCVAATMIVSLAFAADPKAAPREKPLQLDPLRVSATPSTSYPIALEVRVSKDTRKVLNVTISAVQEDSEAAQAGLQPGDEIIKINDQPVAGMDGRINLEAELAKILINRPNGEKLKLEVLTKRTKTVTLHAASDPLPRR